MKKSMDDHVFRDRATELQRAKKLSAADRKKEAKLQASKAPAATQAKGNTKGKTTEKRKKEDVDEEEEHYWDDQEAIDEEEDSYARLRDAQREIVDEEEESEASGVALALLQPRSASKRAWKKSEKLQDAEEVEEAHADPVIVPPRKKPTKSKEAFFNFHFYLLLFLQRAAPPM